VKKILLIVLTLYSQLFSKEICIDVDILNSCEFVQLGAVPISVEHATKKEELCWGLMQREVLPCDSGMLFHYPCPQKASLWMFNCLIDLDAAFLDQCQVIREVRHMYCCPCKMDPCRTVDSCADFWKYPQNDPVIKYFDQQKTVSSFTSVSYTLEMNLLWFQNHGIRPGDVLDWEGDNAWVIHSMDLGHLTPCNGRPIALILSRESPLSVWLPNSTFCLDIAFLDGERRIVEMGRINGSKSSSIYTKQVLYSTGPVKGMIIALPGWFDTHNISVQDELKLNSDGY
jgi:uncharacterized membrane protein (UPF0127 family)